LALHWVSKFHEMISGVVFFAGLAAASAKRGQCYLSGDPHVRTFDYGGWTHHPVYSPGAWYLVHTESGEFTAQAMYSMCGRRTGGGWQGWRKKYNTSAHCLESLALGGSAFEDKALVVQPPCTWNWGEMTCDDCTADRFPRFTYNGKPVACQNNAWKEVAPGIQIHCKVNRAQAKMKVNGKEVTMAMNFWGGAGFEPKSPKKCKAGTHASMHLWMDQGAFGTQCGHCGDFDGNAANDRNMFKHPTGELIKTDAPLCAAEVKDCNQMFLLSAVPKQYNSNGYVVPEDDSLCGCAPENQCGPAGQESRLNVVEACKTSYAQVCRTQADENDAKHKDFFEECVSDTCNGGKAFTDVDVEDEAWAHCDETQSLNDDAVCNHCVK